MVQSEIELAYNKSLNLLARREHSACEICNKLLAGGFGANCIRNVLQKLQDNNLQSDARFTASFIRARINKGQGLMKIKADLRNHKIDQMLIDNYLRELDINWHKQALVVWERKFGSKPETYKEQSRQMRFLQARGFETEVIKSIFKAL